MGHLRRFIFGITMIILSSRTNFSMANGGNIRAWARSNGLLFYSRRRLKIRSEYGAVLKTSNVKETIEEIRLPVPY